MDLKFTQPGQTVALNRKARHNYEITEEIEAGIILTGSEVKAVRLGLVSIVDCYVFNKNGELWLKNMHIGQFKQANRLNHAPMRDRKLLLKSREINKMIGKINEKGASAVVLKVFFNSRNLVKIMLGLGHGKKLYDKRRDIKHRDWQRQQRRELKHKE
ncbi:MAG: SsrA-binding protein SmpB [Pseudomonadota bacterium]